MLKRLLFLFLLNLIIILLSCSNDKQSNADKITFFSKPLDKAMTVQVYKPPGYSKNISYPVLYFIADYGGSSYTVMKEYNVPDTADKMISDEEIFPILIVGVDMDRSFGLDSSINTAKCTAESGKLFDTMYRSYFCDEVIPLIHNKLRA
jgi:enterochelin esterase-like enzyme